MVRFAGFNISVFVVSKQGLTVGCGAGATIGGFGKIDTILLIVLVIILLSVGAKKLPELARGVGRSAKELKKGFSEGLPEEDPKKKSTATTKKK